MSRRVRSSAWLPLPPIVARCSERPILHGVPAIPRHGARYGPSSSTVVARRRGQAVTGAGRSTRGNAAGLTARQAEILDLLAEGLSNPEIAEHLFESGRTVENHVREILKKLDAPNRQEAVASARERGVLTSA